MYTGSFSFCFYYVHFFCFCTQHPLAFFPSVHLFLLVPFLRRVPNISFYCFFIYIVLLSLYFIPFLDSYTTFLSPFPLILYIYFSASDPWLSFSIISLLLFIFSPFLSIYSPLESSNTVSCLHSAFHIYISSLYNFNLRVLLALSTSCNFHLFLCILTFLFWSHVPIFPFRFPLFSRNRVPSPPASQQIKLSDLILSLLILSSLFFLLQSICRNYFPINSVIFLVLQNVS